MGWAARTNPNVKISLWLDDVRDPKDYGIIGYIWVKTVEEAKALIETGKVKRASLDHDLGACDVCLNGLTEGEWLEQHDYQSMPNCDHFGTGYDLCLWMAEHNKWPQEKPVVHSANLVGRERMQGVIERYFPKEPENVTHD